MISGKLFILYTKLLTINAFTFRTYLYTRRLTIKCLYVLSLSISNTIIRTYIKNLFVNNLFFYKLNYYATTGTTGFTFQAFTYNCFASQHNYGYQTFNFISTDQSFVWLSVIQATNRPSVPSASSTDLGSLDAVVCNVP